MKFIKKNIIVIFVFIIKLFDGFLSFLTFIGKSFILLNDFNLQLLLALNITLIIIFFIIIFLEIKKALKSDIDINGPKPNKKYIAFARLAADLGLRYYPKLLGMSPVSPVLGYRFHVRSGEDEALLTRELLRAIDRFCEQKCN